jgi:hypothetical protein
MSKKHNKQLQKLIRAEKGQKLIREMKEHLVRLEMISDTEAKRIPDEDVVRLSEGMHKHVLQSGKRYMCANCWRCFVESGLEWDDWLEAKRQKAEATIEERRQRAKETDTEVTEQNFIEFAISIKLMCAEAAKLLSSKEIGRLFRGCRRYFESGSDLCMSCWQLFVESGLEWDDWHRPNHCWN